MRAALQLGPMAFWMLATIAVPAHADTLLHLSETAHVTVHPDEMVASLRADATAASAADAQGRVNAMIGKALDQAKAVPGITAATGFYQVWQATQPTTQWRAGQAIQLKSGDGPAMLKLVGALQGQGMALERLGWQLAPETGRKARSDATKAALSALRTRAEEAAGILGLRFLAFREVRLDASRPAPMPMPMMRAMAAPSAAMPPPRAETEDTEVEASVDADAVLVPQ